MNARDAFACIIKVHMHVHDLIWLTIEISTLTWRTAHTYTGKKTHTYFVFPVLVHYRNCSNKHNFYLPNWFWSILAFLSKNYWGACRVSKSAHSHLWCLRCCTHTCSPSRAILGSCAITRCDASRIKKKTLFLVRSVTKTIHSPDLFLAPPKEVSEKRSLFRNHSRTGS